MFKISHLNTFYFLRYALVRYVKSLFTNIQKQENKKDTLVQVFSCELCEISESTFFYSIPPAVASDSIRKKLLSFQFIYSLPQKNVTATKSTKSTKFPISSSSSSTVKTLSEGLSSSSMKSGFLWIKLERLIICERSFLHFISFHIPICFFSSVEKIVNKVFDICLASIK